LLAGLGRFDDLPLGDAVDIVAAHITAAMPFDVAADWFTWLTETHEQAHARAVAEQAAAEREAQAARQRFAGMAGMILN
jgi:hypothetical protein